MSEISEYFDEVDQSDEVIGETRKLEAHTKGLIHRVAAVFIFESNGNLLVQVHEKSGGVLDHTVGGHIRSGESYEDGAKREMQEEVGLQAQIKKIGIIYSDETYTGEQFRHMYGLYITEAPKDWRFEPNDEVKELISLSLSDVLAKMATNPRNFTAGFLTCMNFYCKKAGIEFPLDLNQYKLDRLKEV